MEFDAADSALPLVPENACVRRSRDDYGRA